MNYLKAYIALCKSAEKRDKSILKETRSLYEKHHVFPKSIYGKNEKVVFLTLREHYVAHKLLWKAFRKRYGVLDQKTRQMASAFHIMVYGIGDTNRTSNYTSQQYNLARIACVESKTGRSRNDMKGKQYFGASKETILSGIEKMRRKKTGMKVSYPANRKSSPCSKEKAEKISNARKQTLEKYKALSKKQFLDWLNSQKLYAKDGRMNSNVTRAIFARNEKIEDYYGKSV